MIENIAQFKRHLLEGKSMTLIDYKWNGKSEPHKYLNIERKPVKVQTNAVKFEGGSWLQYPKATQTIFKDNTMTIDDGYCTLIYKFN